MSNTQSPQRIRLGPVASSLVAEAEPGAYAKVLDEKILCLMNSSTPASALMPAHTESDLAETRGLLASGFGENERYLKGIVNMIVALAAEKPKEIQQSMIGIKAWLAKAEQIEKEVEMVDYFDRLALRFAHQNAQHIERSDDRETGRERDG